MKYKLKIIDIIDEINGVKTYYFERPDDFYWEAGANIHVGHKGFDEGLKPNKQLVRHMSIITLPKENKIAFSTKVPGSNSEFKHKLSELHIGDELIFFKLGTRMTLRRCNRPIVLLSMGVGMASMRPIILSFIEDKDNIPALINVNVNSKDFLFKNELDKLEQSGYQNYWLSSRREFTKIMDSLVNVENAIYYIVGSDDFIIENTKRLHEQNINREDILTDKKKEFMDKLFS